MVAISNKILYASSLEFPTMVEERDKCVQFSVFAGLWCIYIGFNITCGSIGIRFSSFPERFFELSNRGAPSVTKSSSSFDCISVILL
jgi:hypothetical protein